jgi:hypothetical protein
MFSLNIQAFKPQALSGRLDSPEGNPSKAHLKELEPKASETHLI